MKTADSPFYPPRAGWVSRACAGWYRVRRAMEAKRFIQTGELPSRARLLVWLLVPGAVFFDRARDRFGVVCGAFLFTLWLAAMAFFWIAFGLPATWLAIIAMTAAQSLSCVAALQQAGLTRVRAAVGACATVLVWSFLFQSVIVPRIAMRVEMPGGAFVANPWRARSAPGRGQWVVWPYYYGMSFGQVVGLPGEKIVFSQTTFTVGGTAYRRTADWMPTEGELLVPEKSYFVCPETIYRQGMVTTELVAGLMVVPRDRIAGVAYDHWLWRKQTLPNMLVPGPSSPPP